MSETPREITFHIDPETTDSTYPSEGKLVCGLCKKESDDPQGCCSKAKEMYVKRASRICERRNLLLKELDDIDNKINELPDFIQFHEE